MRLSIRAAVLLWWQARPLVWYKPREGWWRWLIFGRHVYELMDPVIEGCINDAAPAPGWAPTVKVRVGFKP